MALTLSLVLITGMSATAFAESASSSYSPTLDKTLSDQSLDKILGLPYGDGNIFAGVGSGLIKEFKPDGTFVQTLDTTSASFEQTGMCFDSSGNLRATSFEANSMTLFDNSGTVITYPWAGPFSFHPESCVIDAAGDIYVGQADGTGDILKFNPAGTLLDTFDVAVPDRGSDWIDLASDQCTMLYAGEGDEIFRYNVCTHTQLSSFTSGLTGGSCYALRIRSNDQVLVACSTQVHLLNADGTVAHTYLNSDFTPAPSALFALNLDPDGTSFWTADISSSGGQIYHMDIATGTQLGTFNAAAPVDVAGLAIFHEPTVAVCPPGTHGTPPECIPDSTAVGGTIIPIDKTALVIAGASTNGFWVLSILVAIAGASFAAIRFAKRDTVEAVNLSQTTQNYIKPDI